MATPGTVEPTKADFEMAARLSVVTDLDQRFLFIAQALADQRARYVQVRDTPAATLAAKIRAERATRGPMWYEVPPPRRWHRCKPFTTGHQYSFLGSAGNVARCTCGAISFAGGPWLDRNSRRASR